MGRFKTIEIKGLLVDDFGKIFSESLGNAIKISNLTEEEVLKKLAPKFDQLISSYEESITSFYVKHHKFKLDSFLKTHFRKQRRIARAHHDSFVSFILYINGCFNIYEKIISKMKRKKVDSTLKMTVSLYGLTIRRADEILNQLLGGYIDGAMILWRSLYENAITLLILALENNADLADKYFQHAIRNSK